MREGHHVHARADTSPPRSSFTNSWKPKGRRRLAGKPR
uniref:Dihydrouridine synthase 3 like n=1 Tax=Homo sapiens TaxID=9606 RepID=K7ERF2_HUMAN